MPTVLSLHQQRVRQHRVALAEAAADPFVVAAQALERVERLQLEVARLNLLLKTQGQVTAPG